MLKRSILYVGRNISRTLLLLLIFTLIATFVLSGIGVMGASEDASAELRGATGASFTVSRNTATGVWGNETRDGSGNTTNILKQEFVTYDMIEKISNLDGVQGYNARSVFHYGLRDINGNPKEPIFYSSIWEAMRHTGFDFPVIGSFFTEFDSMFLANRFELIRGRHITSSDYRAILISDMIAEKCAINVGDRIYLHRYNWTTLTNAGDKSVEVEVIGIYTNNELQSNIESLAPRAILENSVFADMGTVKELGDWIAEVAPQEHEGFEEVNFFVDDPLRLENIIQNAHRIGEINWNNFLVTANDEVFQRVADPISSIDTLIRTLIFVVIAISVGIITLILTMRVKGRMRETGILMAIGTSKVSIVMQHICEIIIIAVIAFVAVYMITPSTARLMGDLMGENIATDTIAFTAANYLIVFGLGIILLCSAVIVSNIPVLQMKPREILSKMQ